jgi:transposase
MKYYIGLDAHSRTSTFVTIDENGREVSRQDVVTSEFELRKYVQSLKGRKFLTVEESHVADWVYGTLKEDVEELLVCDPLKISKKVGAKTDSIDALHLARELRSGNLVSVYHDPDNDLLSLRILVKQYEGVVRELRRMKSRFKALFLSEARPQDGKTVFSNERIIKELQSKTKQFIAQNLQLQIQQQEEIKELYLEKFKEHHKKKAVIRRLDSIPGFSVIRSCQAAAHIGTADRFENKHQLWSYAGLVRHQQMSGGTCYGSKKGIGRKQLQTVFIEAAQTVCTACKNNNLRKYYDELRSKGFNHKKARRALARKIASISLAVMRTGKDYKESDKLEKNR